MTKTLRVEDVFLLKERGIVAVCQDKDNAFSAKIGDSVRITRPDETIINSQIDDIDSFMRQCFTENSVRQYGLLFSNLSKADIPKGSIINLMH